MVAILTRKNFFAAAAFAALAYMGYKEDVFNSGDKSANKKWFEDVATQAKSAVTAAEQKRKSTK